MTGAFLTGWPGVLLAAWVGVCAAGVIWTWTANRGPLTARDHAETGVYDQHAHQRAVARIYGPPKVVDERMARRLTRPHGTGVLGVAPQHPPVRFGSAGAVETDGDAA